MLLDSNIIIYALLPEYEFLRQFIATIQPEVSSITLLETLGFHKISSEEKRALEALFSTVTILPISSVLIQKAVFLRQQKKMSLGDALVAATALDHGLTLVTRNTKDFEWIKKLSLHNPFPQS